MLLVHAGSQVLHLGRKTHFLRRLAYFGGPGDTAGDEGRAGAKVLHVLELSNAGRGRYSQCHRYV